MIQSLPYDECYDCGAPMTANLDTEESTLNIHYAGKLAEVYVSCQGCGGRAGHREYNPSLHGEF
jgi:hypothetical protein